MALGMEVFTGNKPADNTAVSSLASNLTTSGVNRVVLVFVQITKNASGAVPTVSSVTASGLTFALYTVLAANSEDAAINQRLEIWWAYAAAQQAAVPVTVTLSASGGLTMGMGSISGLPATRYTTPFDADVSLPVKSTNPSATPANASQTFSTHDSNLVSLAVFGSSVPSSNTPDTPSGYTKLVDEELAGPGFINQKLFVFGQVFTAQQVNTVVNLGSKIDWEMITFAVGGNIVYPHVIPSTPGF